MGNCHGISCRAYSGAPFVIYALFAEDQVTVTKGAERLGPVNRTGMSARRFCRRCGGHMMTEHPGMGFSDFHAPVLPDLHFRPVWHLNYAEAVLPVRDGLPKLKDFPAHAGGSGETLVECPKTRKVRQSIGRTHARRTSSLHRLHERSARRKPDPRVGRRSAPKPDRNATDRGRGGAR